MIDGHHNADTRSTGCMPGEGKSRQMPIETQCVAKVEVSVDGSRVNVTASSSWWRGAASGSMGLVGGTVSERSMTCLNAIDRAARIASGHAGFRLAGNGGRSGRNRKQERDVSRGSDMQPGSGTDDATRPPWTAMSADGEERQPWSWFADGHSRAGVAASGRLLIGRSERERSRDGSVGRTCEANHRHGVEPRSGERGDRELGRGMTLPMTYRGARRARGGKYQHMTYGGIVREAGVRHTNSRRPQLSGSGTLMVSGWEPLDADCQRWRRQIGRRGSGEDPEAATPGWAGRWCEASP